MQEQIYICWGLATPHIPARTFLFLFYFFQSNLTTSHRFPFSRQKKIINFFNWVGNPYYVQGIFYHYLQNNLAKFCFKIQNSRKIFKGKALFNVMFATNLFFLQKANLKIMFSLMSCLQQIIFFSKRIF